MSMQSPVGTLDIKNATLRVGKLEVSNIQGIDTALNVTRANSVLIYDDQASTTTFTGFTSSVGVRDTVNGYLDLADGYVYWGQKLPNAWVMDFEMDIRSGTNPGPLYANVFTTTNTGGDGYSFTFNDSNDKISLYYDSTLLTEATVTGLFTATENWQKVVINYERGMIAISLGGSRKFYYKDIERSTPYVNGEYTNFSSASTDGRKIRNLRIVNGEKWMYTGESNIAYTQGSVGIGVSDPQYTLDVGGDINLSGSFYQGGSPFVSSLWTDGGDSLYYRSNVEVGTGNLFVDTTTSRVGIGTRTPGYDLDVNGDINFTGTFYQGGSPFVSSLWTSGNDSLYYTASNVGIGTDTAEYTLDVHGNANVGALTTTSVSGDGSALYGIQSSNVSDFASNVTRIGTLETDLGSNVTRIGTLETDLGDNSSRITSIESGAHTFTGIKTFEDDIILESNLRVQGDLLVANTVHMIVSDPIMELGANNQNIGDLGIIMTRHGETGNVAIVYDESQDVLNVGYTLSNAYENTIAMDTANSLTLQVNGALNVGSNIAMNDTASNVIEVSGNVKTDSLFLGNFEVVASQGLSHVTAVSAATNDTVYLNNPTTGLVVDSNVEIGENLTVEGDLEFNGNLTMNTITVQTLFTLDHVVSQGNTTSNTVQFTNPTTSLTATGNVEVGGELNVSGNVEVGTANLFVDTTTGNVGVGTNNPTSKLHVDGNIVTDQGHYINITRDDTTGGPAFGILNTDGSYSGWFGYGSSNKNQLRMVSNNNYPLTFWTSATGSGVERMRIAPDGNVGIGTTSPGIVLDVGSSLSNPQIGRNYATGSVHDADKRDAIYFGRWDGTGRDFLGIKCRVDTHTALGYGDYSNQTKLEFHTWGNNYASSREVMCIRGDGNVGIGTNNPTRKFQLGIGSGQLGGYLDTYLNSGVVAGMVLGVKQSGGPEMDAMYISDSGYVGIGTNRPLTSFHIKRTGDHSDMMYLEGKTTSGDNAISGGINFKHASAHASGYRGVTWFSTNGNFTMGGVTMAVGGSYNLCRIAFHAAKNRADGSTVRAYIDGNGTGGDLNFTGQHRCFIKEIPFTNIENFEGLIVSANQNEYVKMTDGVKTGSNAITMNESLPVVSLSTKVNDKKCFGVISASEDTETRENRYGNLVSVFEKELGDTRVYINSLGEGAMWVTDINGPLESGDYITTSNVAGYGQRQDDDILHNYTVAKITMDCDFAPATQPIQVILKEISNVNYWVKTTVSNVSLEEYSNLVEDVRTTTTEIYYSNEDGEITTDEYNTLESNVQSTYTELTRTIHQKISTEESKTEQEGSTLEVRQELVNVLDEHGQLQWEDDPSDATEKAYKIRYLDANGNITDEANAVHIAAFVGCTYHCG